MFFTLYEFYFIPNDQGDFKDASLVWFLSSMCTDDVIPTSSFDHYEDSFESNFDMIP